MRHRLYDITLYYKSEQEAEKMFTVKQNIVSDLYVKFLDGYKPKSTTRITVLLESEDEIRGYAGNTILTTAASFDKENYWKKSDKEQNYLILETIHRIATLCAKTYEWDLNVFNKAYQKVLKYNFIYKIEGEKKFSKDKNFQAAVVLEKNEKNASVSVNFYDKDGEFIRTVLLLKLFQFEDFTNEIFRNPKWIDSKEFGLFTKDGELKITASLEKINSEVTITPITKSKEELEGYLKRLKYREINNDADIVQWMNN